MKAAGKICYARYIAGSNFLVRKSPTGGLLEGIVPNFQPLPVCFFTGREEKISLQLLSPMCPPDSFPFLADLLDLGFQLFSSMRFRCHSFQNKLLSLSIRLYRSDSLPQNLHSAAGCFYPNKGGIPMVFLISFWISRIF